MSFKLKETDVAKGLIEYFRTEGWAIYQEVQPIHNGRVADLVLTRGSIIHIVEVKTHFNASVLAQAHAWKGFAHQVSVGVGSYPGSTQVAQFLSHIAKKEGIGIYTVSEYSSHQMSPPALTRRISTQVWKSLRPEHQTFAEAGNAEGNRWSPFKATCQEFVRYVENHPGCAIKEAVNHVRHHYASDAGARSALLYWVKAGKIRGVKGRREGRFWKLFPQK